MSDNMICKISEKTGGAAFSVPAEIVDKHFLRLATGEQIKVLLFILRHSPNAVTSEKIAKELKYSESDVKDYLRFWILTGILEQTDEETAKSVKETKPVKYEPKSAPAQAEQKKPEYVAPVKTREYQNPTQAEVAVRMEESPEIRALFSELQKILGKTIGYDGQCTFICLYDHFGLPADVIFMLVKYCMDIGKSGYSYIEKVGGTWAEHEIDTIEKAAEKIASLGRADKFWKKFASLAGINTPKPTAKQAEYIEKWISSGMSFELVYAAYEQMAEHTGKLSFAYMDKILANWKSQGFNSPDDVDRAEKTRKDAKSKAGNQGEKTASYDLDKFARESTMKPLKYERKNKK